MALYGDMWCCVALEGVVWRCMVTCGAGAEQFHVVLCGDIWCRTGPCVW